MSCKFVTERAEPVSCNHRPSLDLYEQALVQFQSYVGDPIATIESALAVSPDFVLGHAFRALVFMTYAERRFTERARVSLTSAEALLSRAHPRERALVAAARALVDGEWARGCAILDRVLVDHPRDILAIQTAHLFDFFRGDSLNLRNRIARVLPHWSTSVPGYSYVLGMYAFGLEQCNEYAKAEDTARHALALQACDGWAVHAATHVMEMQGRIEEGIAWLTSREPDWAPDNGLAYHNWWHLALFYLDSARNDEVLALFEARIHGADAPDPALQLVDATSLLWRLYLEGVDVADRADRLADNWATRLATERGFYVFNDAHAMMAFAMASRTAEAEQLLADVAWTVERGTGTNRSMACDVGLAICTAIYAFGQGRYADAVEHLEPVRDIASRFGGSHAQRDVLTLTLIEAAIRSHQPGLARHYVAERITAKQPESHWARRLQHRIEGASRD